MNKVHCICMCLRTYDCWGVYIGAQGSIPRLAAHLAFEVAVQQVKGRYKHLSETEPLLAHSKAPATGTINGANELGLSPIATAAQILYIDAYYYFEAL